MKLAANSLILKVFEAANAQLNTWQDESRKSDGHVSSLAEPRQINNTMTKSLEIIGEAIRNPKHPFRKVDNQPKKPLKHRYERRKIKEYLHLGEWISGEAT